MRAQHLHLAGEGGLMVDEYGGGQVQAGLSLSLPWLGGTTALWSGLSLTTEPQ